MDMIDSVLLILISMLEKQRSRRPWCSLRTLLRCVQLTDDKPENNKFSQSVRGVLLGKL